MATDSRIDIYLYNTKGEETTASRAKFFFVYENGKYVTEGEFDRVSDSVGIKEDLILQAISEFEAGITPVEQELDEIAKAKEAVDELAEALSFEIQEESPELAEELREAILEERLSEDLLKEIISDHLEEKIKRRIPATIEKQDKEIVTRRIVGGIRVSADIEKFYFTFQKPVEWYSSDYLELVAFMKDQLQEAVSAIMDMAATIDKDAIIFRLTYDKKINGQFFNEGFGPSRAMMAGASGDVISERIFDDLMLDEGFSDSYKKYLKITDDNTLHLTGFTLENLHTVNQEVDKDYQPVGVFQSSQLEIVYEDEEPKKKRHKKKKAKKKGKKK